MSEKAYDVPLSFQEILNIGREFGTLKHIETLQEFEKAVKNDKHIQELLQTQSMYGGWDVEYSGPDKSISQFFQVGTPKIRILDIKIERYGARAIIQFLDETLEEKYNEDSSKYYFAPRILCNYAKYHSSVLSTTVRFPSRMLLITIDVGAINPQYLV